MSRNQSLFDPRNDEQREQQQRIQNFGAHDQFVEQYFKDNMFYLALEAVDLINQLPYMEEDPSEEGQEPDEKLEAYDVLSYLACESVGIEDDTKITPELMEDYNMVLSQATHALGYLAGKGKGQEIAFESVHNEDSDQLAKTCIHINEQLNYHGKDDDELAIEYVLNAPVVFGEAEGEEIAVEAVMKTIIKHGKKVRKKVQKLRGAAKALRKKLGHKLGKIKKKASEIKEAIRSRKKGKKMGLY